MRASWAGSCTLISVGGGGGVAHIVKRSHVLSAQARFRFENENENEKVSIGYL